MAIYGSNGRRIMSTVLDDEGEAFAVWTESDIANNRIVVKRIEKFDPRKRYPADMSGIVRAKDELDVYRFVESYNE